MNLSTVEVPQEVAESFKEYPQEHKYLARILFLGDEGIRTTVKHFLADYRLRAVCDDGSKAKEDPEVVEWVRGTFLLGNDPKPVNRKKVPKSLIRDKSFKAVSLTKEFNECLDFYDLFGMVEHLYCYSPRHTYLYISQSVSMAYREFLREYYALVEYEEKSEATREEGERIREERKILTMAGEPLVRKGGAR